MKQSILNELIEKAKSEDKAVQLITSNPTNEFAIIEPTHKVLYNEHDIIRCDDTLIDLNFIAAAMIIPNKREREEERKKLYVLNEKGRR